MTVRAYIGLGANIGDREGALRFAVEALGRRQSVEVEAFSRLYETDAVGPGEQSAYLNAAAALACELAPRELLETLLAIELEAGRDRSAEALRWGPRTLDLDLLFYGDQCIEEPGLSLPHPRLHERAFVLEPMCDLAPNFVHPGQGIAIAALASRVRNTQAVRLWKDGIAPG
ncbi:MAG: 2-amino-4-hydroxy-6-hydroxymethyldihydropteridine diphosphokinase [Myxococcota bacterium]|jgi:2-amino-4-hydroxy-6-hydroxymethyldihydropteridine diphosphokinase